MSNQDWGHYSGSPGAKHLLPLFSAQPELTFKMFIFNIDNMALGGLQAKPMMDL